jgi:TPR repeat protein
MAELSGPIVEGADRGEPAMAPLLAHLHRRGFRVPENPDRAYEPTRQTAEAGDLVAAAILGDSLLEGTGTPPDFGEAVVWIRRALPLGEVGTRLALWRARLYRPDLVSDDEAVESVTIASARGDPVARGIIDGGLAERNFTIDGWRLEAREGDPGYSLLRGQLLLLGQPGDRDEAEGLAALHHAAHGKDEKAARILARLYREGARGTPRDAAEAERWASAAQRLKRDRLRRGGLAVPGSGSPGSSGGAASAGRAGQTGERKKPRKTKKAKKPPRRG